jgi:hypothetical protein
MEPNRFRHYIGIDWATEAHRICLLDHMRWRITGADHIRWPSMAGGAFAVRAYFPPPPLPVPDPVAGFGPL